jgi:hypothetical protein
MALAFALSMAELYKLQQPCRTQTLPRAPRELDVQQN